MIYKFYLLFDLQILKFPIPFNCVSVNRRETILNIRQNFLFASIVFLPAKENCKVRERHSVKTTVYD